MRTCEDRTPPGLARGSSQRHADGAEVILVWLSRSHRSAPDRVPQTARPGRFLGEYPRCFQWRPIDAELLALVLEDWAIWRRWR